MYPFKLSGLFFTLKICNNLKKLLNVFGSTFGNTIKTFNVPSSQSDYSIMSNRYMEPLILFLYLLDSSII
jgi:hypothetical protein